MKAIMKTLLGSGILLLFTVLSATTAPAQPTGRVILEVTGAISKTNGDGVMRYDRAMLEALGTREVVTETPWTDGAATFTGVLARDLMADVGAMGTAIAAVALNDYSVEIPLLDFDAYGVILALMKDGEYLTVRDRGPLWVIYPWSAQTDLRNEIYYSRSIWQLQRIDVKSN